MVPYPLATSYFGVEHVAILEHVISGTVLSIPGVGSQPALIDVSLEPDTYSNGCLYLIEEPDETKFRTHPPAVGVGIGL